MTYRPISFGLALIFDKSVNPDYQNGITRKLDPQNRGLHCIDSDGNPVIFIENSTAAAVDAAMNDISIASVGLQAILQRPQSGTPFIMNVTHRDETGIVAANAFFVVAPAAV